MIPFNKLSFEIILPLFIDIEDKIIIKSKIMNIKLLSNRVITMFGILFTFLHFYFANFLLLFLLIRKFFILMESQVSTVKKVIFNKTVKALKILDSKFIPMQNILKEISIHKTLSHPFIVQYVFHYVENTTYNLIMDYAEYNLRSVIHPEIGMEPSVAHLIFLQTLSAVKYLHSKGICHRDIKPDNILLTKDGNIKLSDFGHSTLFYHKEYRRLKSVAGTYSFMAPEVLKNDYDGPSADIWSLGITLLNMLTGKLPWNIPNTKDEKFKAFKSMKYHYYDPFNKLRENTLRLIENMLMDESNRITIQKIENDPWVKQSNNLIGENLLCLKADYLEGINEREIDLHFTQPEEFKAKGCFLNTSQPVQLPNMPSIHRFYIEANLQVSLRAITEALERMVVLFECKGDFVFFSTTDTKRNKIVGEIALQEMNGTTVVTVKRNRGDVLEFKKFLIFLNSHFS